MFFVSKVHKVQTSLTCELIHKWPQILAMKSAWIYLRRLTVDKLRPPGLHDIVAMRVRVRRRPLLLLLSGEHASLSATLHRPRARADRPICTGALLGDNRRGAHVTGWPRPVLLLRRIDRVVGDRSSFTGVQRLTSGSHLRTSVVKPHHFM